MNPADLQMMEGQPDPQGLWELMRREHVEAALMFELDFADEPLLLSNRLIPFVDTGEGREWGAGGGLMISVPSLDSSLDGLAPFREYALGAPYEQIDQDPTWIAAVNAFAQDRANYFRRKFAMHIQFFEDGRPVHRPVTRDVSLIDKMGLSFEPGGVLINMQVESLFGRMGVAGYGKLTYQHQLHRHPGDMGLQFNTEFDRLVTRTDF